MNQQRTLSSNIQDGVDTHHKDGPAHTPPFSLSKCLKCSSLRMNSLRVANKVIVLLVLIFLSLRHEMQITTNLTTHSLSSSGALNEQRGTQQPVLSKQPPPNMNPIKLDNPDNPTGQSV